MQLRLIPEEIPVERTKIRVVVLDPHWTTCAVCGSDLILINGGYSLPFYEGKVVNPDIQKDWAGFPVCKSCYEPNEYKMNLDVFGIPMDKPFSSVYSGEKL